MYNLTVALINLIGKVHARNQKTALSVEETSAAPKAKVGCLYVCHSVIYFSLLIPPPPPFIVFLTNGGSGTRLLL